VAETVLEARTLLFDACHRCCGMRSPGANDTLNCCCGPNPRDPFPAPPSPCPIPDLHRRVVKGAIAPETVTEEWVESFRPRRDAAGEWIPFEPARQQADGQEPAPEAAPGEESAQE
jgi:hypothetical protein